MILAQHAEITEQIWSLDFVDQLNPRTPVQTIAWACSINLPVTRTLETLTSVRFPSSSIFTTYTLSNDSSRGSASRCLFSRASIILMESVKDIHDSRHMAAIIHGIWLLASISAAVGCHGRWPTYRGLYFSFHINDPDALPMLYADNIMAFIVTFFVCPAVVCDAQDKANT